MPFPTTDMDRARFTVIETGSDFSISNRVHQRFTCNLHCGSLRCTRLIMHENLHLPHSKCMQFLDGQVAHFSLRVTLRNPPKRHRATAPQEDYIAFAQLVRVHPAAGQRTALVLR